MKWGLLAASFLTCASCASKPPAGDTAWVPVATDDMGPVVARIGQVSVFAEEVRAEAARAGTTPREALEGLISFHALAETARRSGEHLPDDSDPAVRSALAQRFLEREFEAVTRPEDVPEEDLRALYDKARDTFVHGRLVEIVALSIHTSRLKAAERPGAEATARDLKTHVGLRRGTAEDFLRVGTEPAWRDRGVRLLRTWQGPSKPFSAPVGAEVAKLKSPGDTTPLISDGDGFHIARYIAEKPPRNTAFADVRDKLRDGYHETWRQKRFQKLMDKVTERHRVQVFPQRLTTNAPPSAR